MCVLHNSNWRICHERRFILTYPMLDAGFTLTCVVFLKWLPKITYKYIRDGGRPAHVWGLAEEVV